MKIRPWCEKHDVALDCEPEETDCLVPAENGWYEIDLSHWFCPSNVQAEEQGGEQYNACADWWAFDVQEQKRMR